MKENGLPYASTVLRHDKTAPADSKRAELIDMMIEKNCIGLKVPLGTEDEHGNPQYAKNYHMLATHGRHGPKLFVHGRDVFESSEHYQHFHSEHGDASTLGCNPLLQRITALYSPETLNERLQSYFTPHEDAPYVQSRIAWLKQDHPTVDEFSDLPAVTASNAKEIMSQVMKICDKHNIDMDNVATAARKDEWLEQIKDHFPETFKAYVDQLLKKPSQLSRARRQRNELLEYASKHGYDPEIVQNFCVGLLYNKPDDMPLEQVLEFGRNVRAMEVVVQAANSMYDPHQEAFCKLEAGVAAVMATSVQHQVLERVLDENISFVVANGHDCRMMGDVVSSPADDLPSQFETLRQRHSTLHNDVIAIASPGFGMHTIGRSAVSECERAVDTLREKPFHFVHKDDFEILAAKDRAKLDELLERYDSIMPDSPAADLEEMRKIAGLMRLPESEKDENGKRKEWDRTTFEKVRHQIEVALGEIDQGMTKMMPGEDGDTRREAAPVVMENLKKLVGRGLVRVALPELAQAMQEHRVPELHRNR